LPIRILTFTSLFPNTQMPNFCVFVKYRMQAFADLPGREVRVVAPVPWFPRLPGGGRWARWARVPCEEEQGGLRVAHPRYPLIPKISMHIHWLSLLVAALPVARRLRREFPFDLIDGHFVYPDGLAAVALGRMLGVPVVLSARGSDVNEFSRYSTIRPLVQLALRSADGLIAVCGALRDRMVELGTAPHRVAVVPNGVDAEVFAPVDREEARHRLGLPRRGKIVVSVGSLIERKGQHVLVEAFGRLGDAEPSARLYIVGAGSFRPVVEAKIRELGLSDQVVLVGERPNGELRYWYSAADCSCLASSREGWANVIMESLACGTPVVATNVWGAPEILTTPEVGFLCRRDPADLSEKLVAALRRRWDRRFIRAHVAGRSWAQVAQEVDGVFRRVLGRCSEPDDGRDVGRKAPCV